MTYLVPGVPKYWFKYSWIFRFILTFLHEWHYSKVGTIIVGHPVATLWPPIFSWENSYSEKQEGDIACDFIAKQWNVIVSHNNKARQHYCPAQSRWVSLSVTTETTGRWPPMLCGSRVSSSLRAAYLALLGRPARGDYARRPVIPPESCEAMLENCCESL